MNYRTILLASAAVMFAGSAMAADLTNPFYLPGQGQVTSDTTVEFSRDKAKHDGGAYDGWAAAEEVSYGVNDNLAVHAKITNEFDNEGEYNNSHNFDYKVGASYNMQADKILAQVSASYETWNPKDFYGHSTPVRWQKYLEGEFKLGYDMGNGLTPYVSYGLQGNVDDSDRTLQQTAIAGIHKYNGTWAVDGAVRYEFDTDGKNSNQVWLQAEADYYVKENIALGVYGDYYLAGNDSAKFGPRFIEEPTDTDYNYSVGVRAKVLF